MGFRASASAGGERPSPDEGPSPPPANTVDLVAAFAAPSKTFHTVSGSVITWNSYPSVRLVTGDRSRATFRPRAKQPLLISRPASVTFDPVGTIHSGMHPTLARAAGSLTGTDAAQVMWLRAQVESSSGQKALSSPRLMVVLAAGL